uniref:Uncharacterized protein n=1 Tax=Solanum lycopersicum TaxID=4081 RepID=A0A3Q7HPC8_SOLLC
MVEAGDVWDWEESIWAVETEESMSTTAQAPLIVQGLAPFEVEVAAPRPPFTVYRAASPIQCDTRAVPWNYNKREMNVEETDVATRVTRSGRIYTSKNLVQGSSSKSKAPVVELEDQGIWKKPKNHRYDGLARFRAWERFGAELQGIIEPIQPVRHSTTFGLGYKYTTEEWIDWQPPRDGYYYPLKKPIPPLHPSFRSADFMGGSIDEISDDLKGLSLTKEEGKVCNIVINEEEKGGPSGSKEAKISVSNWTSTPSRPRRASGKIHYKNVESETMAYNETAQLNINDLEEVEDNEVPEELIKRVEEFEEKPNPNLVEIEVVNLGNAKVIQETRVSIHMTKEDKKEYTEFLIENRDIFAWSYADMTGLSTSIVAHRLPTDPACPPVK